MSGRAPWPAACKSGRQAISGLGFERHPSNAPSDRRGAVSCSRMNMASAQQAMLISDRAGCLIGFVVIPHPSPEAVVDATRGDISPVPGAAPFCPLRSVRHEVDSGVDSCNSVAVLF